MAEATTLRGRHELRKTATAAIASGEVQQLADGRAAVFTGLNAAASGDPTNWATEGQYTVAKTTGVVFLDGTPLYWDASANAAHFKRAAGDRDFYLGTCVGDAASADTTCVVNLNVQPRYEIELGRGDWTDEAALGLGVVNMVGGGVKAAFDAVAEIAQAAIYSADTVAVASNPILEAEVAIFDIGDAAALDINIGLANASHATDFDSVTEAAVIHLDGAALDIKAESDDGTTEVAATDTTVDAVDNTYFHLWIDCRDPASVKFYIDGVRVLSGTTFVLTNATGPLRPILHIEKTSDDTTADVRARKLAVRTATD